METIDFIEHERDFIGWALCELVGKKYEKIMTPESKAVFKVELKLNGIEVDFSALCKRLEENYKRAVNEAALELIKEKFDEINTMVYDMERHVTGVVQNALKIPYAET